jgi:hypothetical protein
VPTVAHVSQPLGLVRPQVGRSFGFEHRPHRGAHPLGPGLDDGITGGHALDVSDAVAVPAQQVGWVHQLSLPDRSDGARHEEAPPAT